MAIGLAFVMGAVGWWNPWHLVYLDVTFTWAFLALVVLAASGVLWCVLVAGWVERAAGVVCLVLGGLVVGVVAAVESALDDPTAQQGAANPDNPVEVSLTSDLNVWEVRLRTDRGLLSPERLVARIGLGDSVPPAVVARFTAADELVVTSDGQVVYRVRYVPETLAIEDERCRPFRWSVGSPGCMP